MMFAVYNQVTYHMVKKPFEFLLDAITGEVMHKILPVLPAYHRYVVRAYIKDDDPKHDQGG
jgi:hypothetical protein